MFVRLNGRYSTFRSVGSLFWVQKVKTAEIVFKPNNGRYSTFWSVESSFRVLTVKNAENCLLGLMGAAAHFGLLKVNFRL